MINVLEDINKKYLLGATPSANTQSENRQMNTSGGTLLDDINKKYGVQSNNFIKGESKSVVVVPEKENPTLAERLGNIFTGSAKSYGSGAVSAAGVTSDVLSTSQKRVDEVRKAEEIARYQRNLDILTADLASAKTDKEREKIDKKIQQTKNYIDQWSSFETGFAKDTEVAAEKLNKTADTLAASAQEDIDEAKKGLGFGGQLAVDLGVAGTQLAGDALVAAMTGGSSLLPMAVRSFGGSAQEARQEGATLGQQVAYGAASAALSAGIEKLSNFAKPLSKMFGKGVADDFITKLSGKLGETVAGRTALSAIGEGTEEAIEAILNPILQRITYDKDARITADTFAEAGYNALIGAGLGGVLGAAGEVNLPNRPSQKSSAQETANAENAPTETTANESGAEAIVEPATEQGRDALEAVLLDSVSPTARQINEISKDPAQLERLGIDPNGKTASQLRAEVREALAPKTTAPAAEATVEQAQQSVEQTATQVAVEPQEITQPSAISTEDARNNSEASVSKFTAYTGEETASVGAAPAGFDPISHLETKYGTMPPGYNAVRPDDLPVSTDGKTKVSLAARSMKGAKATPERRVAVIEQAVLDGKYSNVPGTNRNQVRNAAARIRRNGWSASVAKWMANVDNGRISADTVAEGALIYDTAANSDMSDADFTNISVAYAKMLHQTSQATQAGIILKKLRPQSRLYAIEREVAKMNEVLTKEGADGPKIPGYTGIPTWLWMDRVGGKLANKLVSDITPEEVAAKAKTVSQTIYEDLHAIAMRGTPFGAEVKARKAATKTAQRKYIERLLDLFQNEEKYQEARGVAFNTLLDAFGEDEEIMDALESWLDAELDPVALITKELTKRDDIRLPEDIIQRYIDADTDESLASVQTEINEFVKRHTPHDTGLAANAWMDRVGEQLAAKVNGALAEKTSKAQTTSQQILGDLYSFVMGDSSIRRAAKATRAEQTKRTNIERLSDLYHNQDKYRTAWESARNTLEVKYANDPVVLRAFRNMDAIGIISREITKSPDIRLPEDMISRYLDAPTEADRNSAIKEINEFVKRHTPHNAGLPVDAWMGRTGEQLAQRLVNSVTPKRETQKTTSQQVLDDLFWFSMKNTELGNELREQKESLPKSLKRSEIDRISDLFRNPDKYRDAWNSAKNTLIDKYGDNQEVMAALDSWMNSYLDEVQPLTRELTGRVDVRIDPALARKYLQAETEEARDSVLDEIIDSVAADSHATIEDKFNSLLHTAMLGNFKTIERNTLGNVAMKPIRAIHNSIAVGLERAAKTQRTRSLFVEKDLLDAAKRYYENNRTVKEDALGEQKYVRKNTESDFARRVNEKKPIFETKALEVARKGVNWAMNDAPVIGDRAFNKAAYARALAGWLKANNVTAEQLEDAEWRADNAETLDKAHAFAANEAQEATFRNNSNLASLMVKLGNMNGNNVERWFSRILRGIQPFLKTPANVMTAAVQYSPLGFAEAAALGARKSAYDGGKINNVAHKAGEMAEGTKVDRFVSELVSLIDAAGEDISGAEIVNSIAKASTGSMLMVLGMLLRNAGVLRGGEDDDEKQAAFDELVGRQNYAIETPGGKSVTIGWVAPASVPLFMGAELIDQILENGFQLSDFGQAITSIVEPLLTLSMTQGFSDALNDIKYAEGDNLVQLASAAALDRLLQIVPTISGHIERAVEDESTMTYVDRESDVPAWLQKAIGQVSRKVPGWDYNQIPYIDAWGRTEDQGDFMTRLANNLFNPAFVSKVETDAVDTELQRIYDSLGNDAGGIFPTRADKNFSVNGQTSNLSAEEYVTYATAKGQYSRKYVEDAINSSAYKSMSDSEKAKLIGNLYKYANYKAKREAVPDYDNTDFHKAVEAEKAGITPAQFYSIKDKADTNNNGVTKGELDIFFAKDNTLSAQKEDKLKTILFPSK